MKIKRKELNSIAAGIAAYDAQKLQVFKLTLLLTKNSKIIKEEDELFEEAKKKILPVEEVEKFQKEQKELAKSYYAKNEEGEYLMQEVNGQSVHKLTNKAELDGKLEALQECYAKVIDRYNTGVAKIEALMDEEIELPLLKLMDLEHVRHLAPKTLAALAPIIGLPLPESLLEEKGDALKTADVERILEFCEVK